MAARAQAAPLTWETANPEIYKTIIDGAGQYGEFTTKGKQEEANKLILDAVKIQLTHVLSILTHLKSITPDHSDYNLALGKLDGFELTGMRVASNQQLDQQVREAVINALEVLQECRQASIVSCRAIVNPPK